MRDGREGNDLRSVDVVRAAVMSDRGGPTASTFLSQSALSPYGSAITYPSSISTAPTGVE